MMYIHYCTHCARIHMLNGHKVICPKCDSELTELRLSYLEYVSLSAGAQMELSAKCSNPVKLKELSTTYRMVKYSKRYKETQARS